MVPSSCSSQKATDNLNLFKYALCFRPQSIMFVFLEPHTLFLLDVYLMFGHLYIQNARDWPSFLPGGLASAGRFPGWRPLWQGHLRRSRAHPLAPGSRCLVYRDAETHARQGHRTQQPWVLRCFSGEEKLIERHDQLKNRNNMKQHHFALFFKISS